MLIPLGLRWFGLTKVPMEPIVLHGLLTRRVLHTPSVCFMVSLVKGTLFSRGISVVRMESPRPRGVVNHCGIGNTWWYLGIPQVVPFNFNG